MICNTAGCRRGCRAGARWLRLGFSGSLWMAMSPGLRDCLQGLQAPWHPTARAKTSPWHGDVFVPPRQEGCSQCPRGPWPLQVPGNALPFASQLISDKSSFAGVSKAPQ